MNNNKDSLVELRINKPSKLENLEDSIVYRLLKTLKYFSIILVIVISYFWAQESSREMVFYYRGRVVDKTEKLKTMPEWQVNLEMSKFYNHKWETNIEVLIIKFILYGGGGFIAVEVIYRTFKYILFGKKNT